MLNSVATNIAKATRQVTLRHPNSMKCHLMREIVLRQAPDSMGGIPTLGGLGVLDATDESEIDYEVLGAGKVLIVENYQASSLNDRETTVDMQYPQALAVIEPLAEEGDPDYFTPKKHDLVFFDVGIDIFIGFEIVDIVSDVNIPPYTRKYVLNKRDELTYVNGKPLHP